MLDERDQLGGLGQDGLQLLGEGQVGELAADAGLGQDLVFTPFDALVEGGEEAHKTAVVDQIALLQLLAHTLVGGRSARGRTLRSAPVGPCA